MPAKPIDNERRACDAVVRVLEERHGAVRADGRSPEDERIGSPVEYVFDLGGRTYAPEHTVVEAFDGQIHKDVGFRGLRGADRCRARPPDAPARQLSRHLRHPPQQRTQTEAHGRSAGCDRCVGAHGGS